MNAARHLNDVPTALALVRATPDYQAMDQEERQITELAAALIVTGRRLGMDPCDLLDEMDAARARSRFRVIEGGRA